MNKNELVDQIAERSGLSKGQASEALGATISAIEDGLAAGQEIAITGFGMDDDIARCRDAGFNGHLTKPVHLQKLEDVIRQVLSAPDPVAPPPAS